MSSASAVSGRQTRHASKIIPGGVDYAIRKLVEFYQSGNFLLVVTDAIVLITSLMAMLEAVSVISSFKKGTVTKRHPGV